MTTMINQYQQNQISTASPEQILLMLYDGAIRFTRQAITAFDNEDNSEMRHGVRKTLAIIIEFSDSLDHKIGGKIAEDLDSLYYFMIKELTDCNITPNRQKLEGVEKILVDLRATWGEAVTIKRTEEQTRVVAKQSPYNSNNSNSGAQSYSSLSVSG